MVLDVFHPQNWGYMAATLEDARSRVPVGFRLYVEGSVATRLDFLSCF